MSGLSRFCLTALSASLFVSVAHAELSLDNKTRIVTSTLSQLQSTANQSPTKSCINHGDGGEWCGDDLAEFRIVNISFLAFMTLIRDK